LEMEVLRVNLLKFRPKKRKGGGGGAGPIPLGEKGGGGLHPAKTPALGDLGVRTDGAGFWRRVVVAEVLVDRGEEAA